MSLAELLLPFVLLPSLSCAAGEARECSQDCLVTVSGLGTQYERDASVHLVLVNHSSAKVQVNVSVQAQMNDSWAEVDGSIFDARKFQPKMTILFPLERESSAPVLYDLKTMPSLEPPPRVLRFRIETYVNGRLVEYSSTSSFVIAPR